MAKPSPLSLVAETGEERPAVNVQTEEALQKLLGALEARQRRSFDPRMLAMASAFLTPSSTGSAFEGMGRAARAYAGADEAMRQEEIEMAKERLGLLGQMAQLQRAGARDKAFNQVIESIPPLAPGGVKPPAAETEESVPGSEAYAPAGFSGMGIQIMPGNPALLADRRVALDARARLRLAQQDPSINIADAIDKVNEADAKAMEAQRKRYQETERGVIDYALGLLYEFPKGTEPVERQIFGNVYKVPPIVASRLDFYQMNGDTNRYNALVKSLGIATGEAAQKPRELPGVRQPEARQPEAGKPQGAVGIKSQQQIEQEAARRKAELEVETAGRVAEAQALQKGAGELEAERRRKIVESGDKAGDSRRLAMQFLAFANRPDADQIFGFAARPELRNQIVRLLTSGVGFTGASIGIPELMDSVRTMDLTPEQMAVFQTFAQLTTELSLRMSEAVKGSVSNYEQGLFQKAVVNVDDLPKTIKMKAAMLDARAVFDQEIAKKFSESNMTVQGFRNSDEYKNAVKRYEDKLTMIVEGKPREQVRREPLTADQIRAEAKRRAEQRKSP